MRRPMHALAAVASLALTLAGCASGKETGLPAGPTTPPASKVCTTVDLTDALQFVPKECTVKVGTTLTWKNIGGVPHTVTEVDEKIFDSGATSTIGGGGTFTFTFKKAGEYPYYCRLHSSDKKTGMTGTVIVEAGSGGSSGSTSPSPSSS